MKGGTRHEPDRHLRLGGVYPAQIRPLSCTKECRAANAILEGEWSNDKTVGLDGYRGVDVAERILYLRRHRAPSG